jgi:hypothetical protein
MSGAQINNTKEGIKMESFKNALVKFFGVAVRGQTYLNALYLLLAFPLGLFYFVFLVTGLSAGIPLVIVWVGLLVLVLVIAGWYGLAAFERQMAIWLLHEQIPPMSNRDFSGKNLWHKFVATLGNPVTWKSLVYLLVKFPLGTLSFVLLVTLVSISGSLLATPFYYQFINPQIDLTINHSLWNPAWMVNNLAGALVACLIGVFLTLISMHILNGLAWVSGKFARVMLGNFASAPTGPAAPVVIEEPSAPESPPATGEPAITG